MIAALIAYLELNPQVVAVVANQIIELIMSHRDVADADKVKLQMIIDRLDKLAQHEQDIIDGKSGN